MAKKTLQLEGYYFPIQSKIYELIESSFPRELDFSLACFVGDGRGTQLSLTAVKGKVCAESNGILCQQNSHWTLDVICHLTLVFPSGHFRIRYYWKSTTNLVGELLTSFRGLAGIPKFIWVNLHSHWPVELSENWLFCERFHCFPIVLLSETPQEKCVRNNFIGIILFG